MSNGKQFTLYSILGGSNGAKVAYLLEELGLTYDTIFLDYRKDEQKSSEHIKLNPNGRIPTIIDHKNSDFSLWESNAILQYLVDQYDKEGKFSVTTPEDKYKQSQWLYFQASGQGPYFGQLGWFKLYHPEKFTSAIDRYEKEVKRVFGVLESVLSKQDWLVGGKYTIADLSFLAWHNMAVNSLLDNFDCGKEYPSLDKWAKTMDERSAIKKVNSHLEALKKA